MHELEDIIYGPDIDRRTRYLNRMKTDVMSPLYEKRVKELFSLLGKVEKIPRAQKATFDFKIDSVRLLIEVTSLDVDEMRPAVRFREKPVQDILSKLEAASGHVLSKSSSSFPGYHKGAVLFYTLEFNFYTQFHEWLRCDPVDMYRVYPTELDFLMFICIPASVNGRDSWQRYPPTVYVKEKSLIGPLRRITRDKAKGTMIRCVPS